MYQIHVLGVPSIYITHINFCYVLCFSLDRVYSDEARHELELLKSTWLIDEFEQSLKSVQHYKTTLEHILREAPELTEYLQHYAAVLTGDHPTWKYNKKIVAEVRLLTCIVFHLIILYLELYILYCNSLETLNNLWWHCALQEHILDIKHFHIFVHYTSDSYVLWTISFTKRLKNLNQS